jgi:hypothetical protein
MEQKIKDIWTELFSTTELLDMFIKHRDEGADSPFYQLTRKLDLVITNGENTQQIHDSEEFYYPKDIL